MPGWRELEALYRAAQGLSTSERERLLANSDPKLRAIVTRMLFQERHSPHGAPSLDNGAWLDRPAWEDHRSLVEAEVTESPIAIGTLLGPYRIEERIGQGGMGEVFQATDIRLDRTVAIKASLVQFSERFEREARAVAKLNHPNICTLFDVGPNYLVMELVAGPTLTERI